MIIWFVGAALLGLGLLLYLAWQLHLQKRATARRESGLRTELEEASVRLVNQEERLRAWEQERVEERQQHEKEHEELDNARRDIRHQTQRKDRHMAQRTTCKLIKEP